MRPGFPARLPRRRRAGGQGRRFRVYGGRRADAWTECRRKSAYRYNEALSGTSVVTPVEIDNVRAVYHLYVIRVPGGRRDELQEYLKTQGISTGIHYPIALPYLNAYRHIDRRDGEFEHSLKASGEILSLPMFPELAADQVAYVAEKIASAPCLRK